MIETFQWALRVQGVWGFKQILWDTPVATLDWESSDLSPFFNINDPDALLEASGLPDRAAAPI